MQRIFNRRRFIRSVTALGCGLITALGAAAVVTAAPLSDLEEVIETRANEFTSNAQEQPAVAVDPSSGVTLVVWGSRRQEAGGFGIFGRLFDAEGQPIGGEIHINQTLTNNQEHPAVAFSDDGVAWVVWQSYLQDGDAGAVVLRRFGERNGALTALGDEAIVNTIAAGDQRYPSIALSGDRALVMWETRHGEHHAIAARVFDAEGNALAEQFSPAADTTGRNAALPTAAALADGSFIAAWAERTASGNPLGITAQRIDRDGRTIGEAIAVAADDERRNIEPAIASNGNDRFAIAWMAENDVRGWDVLARIFDAAGALLGDEITVDRCAPDAWKSGVDLAMHADGTFTVAFNVEGDHPVIDESRNPHTPADIVARRFDAQGAPMGDGFIVNASRDGRQILPAAMNTRRIAQQPCGGIAVAWEGAIDNDGSAVGVTMLRDPAGALETSLATARIASIDPALLASHTLEGAVVHRFPPEWDPFFRPGKPDPIIPNPGPDFGFQAFMNTGWTPPDPDLAVGPDHVVVAVNGGIRIFDKLGNLLFEDDISGPKGFWGEVGANYFVFDPVAVFDVHSQRYIVATTEHADNGDDLINLAVSDDADATGTWHKYRFNFSSVGGFIDFPNLGVGPDAIYITADYFSGNSGNRIHIFDKADVLNGDPTTPNVITTGNLRSLGSVNHLTADAPAQYFVTSWDGSNSQIVLDAVRDPNGSPIRNSFTLNVPGFAQPPDAEQQGSSNRVSTVDFRTKNGVYRDGFLWVAHTIGENSTARVRWYQIAMNGWPTSGQNPALVDVGTQNLGPGQHNWFPDISVDEDGIVGIAFNKSSSAEFVSVQRTFRLPTDSPGTLHTPVLQQVSDSPEPGSRWGDYGGIEQDPAAPGVFWNHHEYRTTGWRTWVGKFDVIESLPPIAFEYPLGRPEIVDAAGGTTMLVEIIEHSAQHAPGTGRIFVDVGDGNGFTEFAMTDLGNNLYEAEFPPAPCGNIVRYYLAADTTAALTMTDPASAPADAYTAEAFTGSDVVFQDNFENQLGWTIENVALTDGSWERGIPAGDGSRGDPTSDFDGSGQCYLTANRPGNSDVDGGPTRLISPTFDITGVADARVRFARWFSNDDEDDPFTVEVSNSNGASWAIVDQVIGGDPGWEVVTFRPADFVTPTSTMKVRLSVTDNPNNSVTEAGVDAFEIITFSCDPVGATELVDFDFTFGTHTGGGLAELIASDDTYVTGASQFGFSAQEPNILELLVGAETTVSPATDIDLLYEGKLNNPGGNGAMRLKNWSTSQFEVVRTFTVGTAEVTRLASNLDATDRIRGSDGRIEMTTRISVVATFSASGFTASFDRIDVSVD